MAAASLSSAPCFSHPRELAKACPPRDSFQLHLPSKIPTRISFLSASSSSWDQFQQVKCADPCSRPSLFAVRCDNRASSMCSEPLPEIRANPQHLQWMAARIVFWAAFVLVVGAFSSAAIAAPAGNSIGTSSLGLKVASLMRGSGWPDEAVVFVIAMLPVLELRGAIPMGYWLQIPPLTAYMLAVAGNMVPIPFILIYLGRLSKFVASKSEGANNLVNLFLENTRQKAAPIQEFEWLGLMLFVAVPLPGTGAWTGGIAASILGMPFWEALSANFVGVLLAGILVNLLVSVGVRYAILVCIAFFFISTFMWSFLRMLQKKKDVKSEPTI